MKHAIQLSAISSLPIDKMSKSKAKSENIRLIKRLAEIQDKLYAQSRYSVLIILQGMDTAGKDGAVKHVFSGVNPAGCNVKSFKVPTTEEVSHQFLWRVSRECPAKGMMQIFNRSHYEGVLMPKVYGLVSNKVLKERCEEINVFEKGLRSDRTIILKFFLHISHAEQLRRLKSRRTDVTKRWKFQKADVIDIKKHTKYKKAYEFIIKQCSLSSPWKIIPADKKWYKNYSILKTIVTELNKYDIDYPKMKLRSRVK